MYTPKISAETRGFKRCIDIVRRTEQKIGEIPAHAKTEKANNLKGGIKYIAAQKDKEIEEKRGYTPGIGGSMQFIGQAEGGLHLLTTQPSCPSNHQLALPR